MTSSLVVIQPFQWRTLDVPNCAAVIDWVSFDSVNRQAKFVIGLYVNDAEAKARVNRLDTLNLDYSGEAYEILINSEPEIFAAIVNGVNGLAVDEYPETLQLKEGES